MTSPLSLADDRVDRQRLLTDGTTTAAVELWGRVDYRDIARSWLAYLPRVLALLVGAQAEALRGATEYTTATLVAQGIDPAASATAVPDALIGTAADGRTLDTLLYEPVVRTLTAVKSGAVADTAMAAGSSLLQTIFASEIADIARGALAVDTTTRRHVGGYTRAIVGSTCGRCTVLAGRFYQWNEGFQRHPKCDCIHVPTSQALGAGQVTDPKAYFASLSKAEQDHQFTVAGAEAIRRGADIGQVVNARRGAYGLAPASKRLTAAERAELGRGRLQAVDIGGRKVYVTTAGLGRRPGKRVRLMPESILAEATSREDALRLFKVHGYIT